jgi:uncharacterized membrane protein YqhA
MTDSSPSSNSEGFISRLAAAVRWMRLVTLLAILSSLVSSLVMFWIGTTNTLHAILLVAGVEEAVVAGSSIDPAELATIELLECLDDFLVGLAFLYFASGIYSLFILMGKPNPYAPPWLRVTSISSLKKTLLEVLVVLLAVIFVKGLLERLSFQTLEWTYLVIPLSILSIAASTRLLQFEAEEVAPEPREADK